MTIPKFSRPAFSDLLASYRTPPSSVHDCALLDPTQDAVDTAAARLSEALVIANRIARDRAEIAAQGKGHGSGAAFLLGNHGYARFGRLCPHGIARAAQDLGAFLENHWGARTLGWQNLTEAPAAIKDRTGVVLFMKLPGRSGQGHVDLWNKTAAVGHAYWNAETVSFWHLS